MRPEYSSLEVFKCQLVLPLRVFTGLVLIPVDRSKNQSDFIVGQLLQPMLSAKLGELGAVHRNLGLFDLPSDFLLLVGDGELLEDWSI